MNKEKIKQYAHLLIEALEKDEKLAEEWAKGILRELESAPHKIHEKLERIERKLKKKRKK